MRDILIQSVFCAGLVITSITPNVLSAQGKEQEKELVTAQLSDVLDVSDHKGARSGNELPTPRPSTSAAAAGKEFSPAYCVALQQWATRLRLIQDPKEIIALAKKLADAPEKGQLQIRKLNLAFIVVQELRLWSEKEELKAPPKDGREREWMPD